LTTTPTFTQGRKEVMKMGMSKNLMIAMYPDFEDEPDDFLVGNQLDDFLKSRQADEPEIHQPAVVK
jgi:hypothetical protein